MKPPTPPYFVPDVTCVLADTGLKLSYAGLFHLGFLRAINIVGTHWQEPEGNR